MKRLWQFKGDLKARRAQAERKECCDMAATGMSTLGCSVLLSVVHA
jgi:hypothetical protein